MKNWRKYTIGISCLASAGAYAQPDQDLRALFEDVCAVEFAADISSNAQEGVVPLYALADVAKSQPQASDSRPRLALMPIAGRSSRGGDGGSLGSGSATGGSAGGNGGSAGGDGGSSGRGSAAGDGGSIGRAFIDANGGLQIAPPRAQAAMGTLLGGTGAMADFSATGSPGSALGTVAGGSSSATNSSTSSSVSSSTASVTASTVGATVSASVAASTAATAASVVAATAASTQQTSVPPSGVLDVSPYR